MQSEQTQNGEQKQVNIDIPNNTNLINSSIQNLYLALNKANKAGVYELGESHQLMNDMNLISSIVLQITKPNKK